MTVNIQCPLCGQTVMESRERSEVYQISCPSCGVFKITRECRDDLPAERRLQSQLIKVSAFTRSRTIRKEPVATLFYGDPEGEGYSIQQVIDQFPSVSDRKLKALSNLEGLSQFWGDAVSIERQDYPIFYPEVNQEQPCLLMMKTLVDEGLIVGEVKFPTQLTVTDKGATFLSTHNISAPMEPSAPPKPTVQLDKLDNLHPKVLAVAQKLFQDGHFRSAVFDTYVALNNEVQQKSGLPADGSALMQRAFSKDAPVIKVAGGNDPQLGAMWLFSGAMMGVRNVLAHNHTAHLTEQEALEWLHFASALYRILDSSVI